MSVEFDPTRPLELARTIPAGWYTDPAMLDRERRTVFARSWQAVGRVEQVAEVGHYVTADIAGEPVLVVRGSDGVLRSLFNVCRHRAAPLLTDGSGCVGKLRCRYHGWTYDLAGQLRGTPEFDGVCDFTKEQNGLVPVGGVAECGPFVWVHLDPPREPAESAYAPFVAWATTTDAFAGLTWRGRKEYDLACNWKVFVDNYLDGGYHVATVHPALAEAIDYKQYRTEVFPQCSVQTSPMQATTGAVGATRTGDAAYWWLFPNVMVNHYAGVMDTNRVLPLSADRCRVTFDFYFAAGASESFVADSIAVADAVQQEDGEICEQVQRGLHSRSYSTGRFSVKREGGGYAFHRLLAERLAAKE